MYYIDFVLQQEQVKCRLLLLRGWMGQLLLQGVQGAGVLWWGQARVLAGGAQR